MTGPVRVLIVDDSPLVQEILKSIFKDDPEIEIAGTANNGEEAVRKVKALRPHLVTMDLQMPVMDGFAATEAIMTECPTPILVLSSSINNDDVINSMKALAVGALDVMEKPGNNAYWHISAKLLQDKVKLLSRVKVTARVREARQKRSPVEPVPATSGKKYFIIGIGTSTGGPNVLKHILKELPEDFSPGIVIVQHMTDGFTQGLVDWLDGECHIKVKIAERDEWVQGGRVYIAPDKYHIKVMPGGRIKYDDSPPLGGHRPAADVLLKSIAASCGSAAAGIILTGMGKDGAEGIKAIKDSGGFTMAQSQESCVVFGMPKVAIELGGVDKVLSEEGITHELLKINASSRLL